MPQLPDIQAIAPIRVLGEHILEPLRHKPPLGVVRAGVAPVLAFVDVGEAHAEIGVWDARVERGVRERGVDDEDGQEGQQDPEAELVEAAVCICRIDYVVVVGVEEGAVLL